MTRKITVAAAGLLGVLALFNLIALGISISQSSGASARAAKYEALLRDPDFAQAVKTIVQKCKVNVDVATITC